jgi:nucleotide-binding universal stress UspA family protein
MEATMSYDVVIPLDGSEASERALVFAAQLPLRKATLLRVDPDFQVLRPGSLQDFREDWRDIVAEEVQEELRPLVDRLQASERGIEIEAAVRFGDPATEIIDASTGADLIVMTTQGRGGVGRAFFGSVADRVVRHGTVPTLVIRAGQFPVSEGEISRLVVPLDGSEAAEAALPEAARMARALDVPVRLVHVADPEARGIPSPFASRDVRGVQEVAAEQVERAESYLKRHAARLTADGVAASTEVQTGGPVTVLLDLLKANDLLVMTTLGLGGLQRWWIGSVAEKLIREAICPVLVVRKDSVRAGTSAQAAAGTVVGNRDE